MRYFISYANCLVTFVLAGEEQQLDAISDSDSLEHADPTKKNWDWYWQDSNSEDDNSRDNYRKRYLQGKDKFLHFG